MNCPNLVITGATSGFGSIIAKEIVKKPCRLVIFARSKEKSRDLETKLASSAHADAQWEFISCDLSSLHSVVDACDQVLRKYQRIDTLIQNAGIMSFAFQETVDGIEETFQINLLAPMLITRKLRTLLPTDGSAKILYTASALHQGTIHFNDLEYRENFSSFKAYRHSKLGVILMTRLQAQQDAFSTIKVVAIHPGMIRTELGRQAGWFSRMIFYLMGSSVEKGARTHLQLLNTAPKNLVSGEYYANAEVKKITPESYDQDMAKRLSACIEDYLKSFLSE